MRVLWGGLLLISVLISGVFWAKMVLNLLLSSEKCRFWLFLPFPVAFLRFLCAADCVFAPPERPWMKKIKKSFRNKWLSFSADSKKDEKKRKKILAVWKMVVFLHSLSPGKRDVEKRKRKDIEKVETRDSVCRRSCIGVGLRTRRVKGKNKRRNSYNEEFDPGSG